MDFFEGTVARICTFPVENLKKNIADPYKFFLDNNLFQLSILLSSRALYDDIKKGKRAKVQAALRNYYYRSHFNPVPFGTHSSIGLANWGKDMTLTVDKEKTIVEELDNLYVTRRLNNLNFSIKRLFYTNPSIHNLGSNSLGFYKSEKLNNGNFESKYSRIENSEASNWTIKFFKNGKTLSEARYYLKSEGFQDDEIFTFLNLTISSGLILDELIFYAYRRPVNEIENIIEYPTKKVIFLSSDFEYQSYIDEYFSSQDTMMDKVEDGQNLKYTKSITYFNELHGTIPNQIKKKLRHFIYFSLLSNGKNRPVNNSLSEFGQQFYHRFQDRYTPIGIAFNPYSGLSYKSTYESLTTFPNEILNEVLNSQDNEVHLEDYLDYKTIDTKYTPVTFSVIYEFLRCKKTGKEILYCKYLTGASAIPFLGRFDHVTDELCSNIAKYEKQVFKDKIIAEINFFSKPRTNNIMASRQYYDYNIPINTVPSEGSNPILLEDIFLRYNGERFSLISKSLGKEIVPRVTSAVNPEISDSNIYKFLTDLQYQGNEAYSLNFNFNYYQNFFISFVPRIFLGEDILLSPAQLLLVWKDLQTSDFRREIRKRIEHHSFSDKVSFFDGKGEVFLDTNNTEHLEILLSKLKNVGRLYISEVLYESYSPLIQEEQSGHLAHEMITSVKGPNIMAKSTAQPHLSEEIFHKKEYSPINDGWLSLELYCSPIAETDILKRIYSRIEQLETTPIFYYVRYNYPANHLRLRFQTENSEVSNLIINQCSEMREDLFISSYFIVPYEPEIHRYGGKEMMKLAEEIFFQDSIDTLSRITDDFSNDKFFIFAVLKIETFLSFFNMDYLEMIELCQLNISGFSNEFTLTVREKKELQLLFIKIKVELLSTEKLLFLSEKLRLKVNAHLKSGKVDDYGFISDLIHMSMNRLFREKLRINEFRSFVLAKKYFEHKRYMDVKS